MFFVINRAKINVLLDIIYSQREIKMKAKLFSIFMIFCLFIVLGVSCKQNVNEKEKEHTFGEWTVITEPTCTSIGIKKRICSGCGFEETEIIPAEGHNFDDGVITTAPTCTSSGVKTYTCSACKETKIEIISAKGHSYGEEIITKEPTCTEEGIKTCTCSVCKEVKIQSIQALGHSFDGIKCSRCGQYSVKLSEVGKTYTDIDGLDVVLNNFTYSDVDGYNNYSINYTLKNNKQGSEITPGIFKIIYKTSSGALESNYQTGFFNNLYYNDTLTRSYNWKLTSDKTLVCLEYIAGSQMENYIFSSTPSDSLLNWALGIISSTTDNNILSIILTQDTTAPSRGSVTVNVEIPNCSVLNMVKYSLGSKNTNFFETDGILIVPVNGVYSFTVKENGTYTIFAFDNDGRRETKEIEINNIDSIPPATVTNLKAKYDADSKSINVSWVNPTDSDFDYVELSYTKGGISTVSNVKITDNTYSISNVEIDGDEYIFTVYAVDKAGNKSVVSTVSLIPSVVPSVQSISLSRYHLAYNDPDQTITATAVINNADLIEEGTVVKFQTKDPSGNVTNTVASVDKTQGKATAILTAPVTPAIQDGITYTVLCKIGDESADTVHTNRFNVSDVACISKLTQSYSSFFDTNEKIQIALENVSASTKETVRIKGYNLDLTSPSIQLYDSTGTAYFDTPVLVDTSSIKWTAVEGSNYQTLDTLINIPNVDDFYTVKVLFDDVIQINYSRNLQVFDVPKFTSLSIPTVSVSKKGKAVTATIIGKNFDTPDVDFSNFTAICSTKPNIVANTSFKRLSDSMISATFTIPESVGKYEVIITYGLNSVTGILKVADFSTYSVGDVLLNDGTIIAYSVDSLSFTEEQKQQAVGVIYAFNEYGVPAGYLGINNSYNGTNSGRYMWATPETKGYNINFTDIQCTPSVWGSGAAERVMITGDTEGIDNWAYICSIDSDAVNCVISNYPVFNYVNNYAKNFGITGDYTNRWYLPSLAELCCIYRNKTVLNSVLDALNGIKLYNDYYWSSSQYVNRDDYALYIDFRDGNIICYDKNRKLNVCVIHPFDF